MFLKKTAVHCRRKRSFPKHCFWEFLFEFKSPVAKICLNTCFCFKVMECKIRWLCSKIIWQFEYTDLAKNYSKFLLGYVKYYIMNSFHLTCFVHGFGKSMQYIENTLERLCSLCIVVSKIFQYTKSIKLVLQFQVTEWKNPSPFNSYLKKKDPEMSRFSHPLNTKFKISPRMRPGFSLREKY